MNSKIVWMSFVTVIAIVVANASPAEAVSAYPARSGTVRTLLQVLHQQPHQLSQVAAQTCGTRYVVRRGDTLSAIARRCGVSVLSIVRANGMRSANFIRIGQVLVIPRVHPVPKVSPQGTPVPVWTPGGQLRAEATLPPVAEAPVPTPPIEPTVSVW